MKRLFDNERIILQACEMYYYENMTQTQICQKLDISRPTLGKILAYARQSGIVKITISSMQHRNHFKLEALLEKKFGLREVVITDSCAAADARRSLCGQAAASYLSSILKDGDTVGIGMGSLLTSCAANLTPTQDFHNLTFIPLIGGLSSSTASSEDHSNYLCELFAKNYHAAYYPLFAPARVESTKTRDELMRNPNIKYIFDMTKQIDVALVTIGAPTESGSLAKSLYFASPEFSADSLQGANVCGDFNLLCYDRQGRTDIYSFNSGVIAADASLFQNIPYSIGLASGVQKKDAILGAIAGRFINVLITDADCAGLLAST